MAFFDALNPAYSASGFAVGLIVGMTGVGGGAFMTPLLVLLFGVHPATAVGTDLLYAGITKAVGTAVHAYKRTVNWRIVALLASGSVPAAAATLTVISLIGIGAEATSTLISYALGLALVITAATLLVSKSFLAHVRKRTEVAREKRAILTIGTGVVLGVLVSLSSVGAGAIGITVLYFLYPRLAPKTLVGSDLAHAVPLTLVGGIGYWLINSVDLSILLSLLAGSVPGIATGSVIAPLLPDRILRSILAIVLLLAGVRMLFA